MNNKFTLLNQKRLINLSKKNLKKTSLIKSVIKGQKNTAGKNNSGKITVYHKGGGHKKKYRKINLMRNNDSIGIVTSLEYDPYRTAFIASVYDFLNSSYFYMIAPKNLNIGDIVKSGFNAEIKIGHSLTLMKIPVGSFIHNISLRENKEAQLSRSAGTHSQLIEKTSKYCRIILSSGKHKFLSTTCHATIGTVSNEFLFFKILGKAGRNRWLNKRPTVRGVAMNPIDHPHGGGEGKSSGGRSSVTPWGKPTKNGKTSSQKKSKFLK
jgi:large subunit ribosomal protein L2